jgi:homocysteine S-methyltransferase
MNGNFLQTISEHPLVFDGAMGTMIYQKGVFVNACYDELCLSRPSLISEIHRDYVAAGADVVETNSFGANRINLAGFGLAEKTAEINEKAVRLARREAGESLFVAASCGPCIKAGETAAPPHLRDIGAAFDEQTGILAAAGADLILFETFHCVDELLVAARAARRHGLPVVGSVSPAAFNGTSVEAVMGRLNASPDIDVIGVNCLFGPAEMLETVRLAMAAARKPLVIMPNAGGPHEVGGRTLYLNSPEYFTEYAKKYIELGARGVGGCCGTTPAHIRMAAQTLHVMSGVKSHIAIRPAETAPETPALPPLPFADKSPFTKKLAAGKPVTSVEMLPPRSAAGLAAFLAKCRVCQEAGIDAVNLPDGPRASARMSVIATAYDMQSSGLSIEPIPHCCCRDRNLIGLQSDIIGGVALGLKTWLFITGDPPKLGNYPDATGVFDVDAIGLSRLCSNLNRGLDAAAQPLGSKISFAVGVGVNPAAIDMDREIERFFAKIDAGAEYAITQPVFDAESLLRFLDRLSRHEKSIPVIVGLYPLMSAKNADFMNRYVPGVSVPEALISRLGACMTKESAVETGIDIARGIRAAVENAGVAGFQVSAPLGRTDIALDVLK